MHGNEDPRRTSIGDIRVLQQAFAELVAVPLEDVVGGAMERYALAAFLKCAREMKDQGAFTYVREMAQMKPVKEAFSKSE